MSAGSYVSEAPYAPNSLLATLLAYNNLKQT